VTTTAAPVGRGHASDEFVREARARYDQRRLELRARRIFATWGSLVGAGALATAISLDQGPAFSLWRVAFFAGLYALVSRVEFEVGTGAAIPTQLVLVPMLFALPLGLVPATVAAGTLLRTTGDHPSPLRDLARIPVLVANAAHTFGPVLVLAVFDGLPLRWSAWPVYLLALVAQFAFDFLNGLVNAYANRVPFRSLVAFVVVVYEVDIALTPVGLALAFATQDHTLLVATVLPLVWLLRTFARERQQRIDNALELSDAYRGTAFLLGDVVEADDAYTGTHSRHVVELVLGVADELGLDGDERRDAEFVGLLHDVGKIRVPSEIINKPGPLTAEERAVIERHTIDGEQMLERVGGLLGHVGRLVRSCHEHWNGGGYPDKLAGEEIPLIARIVCACDAFSAMTTDRPYRAARSHAEAIAELRRCAGTQFDPRVVDAIVSVAG
jgi:HD-GYP domain-containing protein (c-di-GMP phosphodiesterase class II)